MSFRYHPFYCEENVWWLAQEPRFEGTTRWVLFVTGHGAGCAFWHQRARPEGPILWDYHVVLLVRQEDGTYVWDLDTVLDHPIPLDDYLARTFLALPEQLAEFRPRFRLVAGDEFLSCFCTDREHMRAPDGGWLRAPPPWDPPRPKAAEGRAASSNLARFLNLDDDIAGQVVDGSGLRRLCSTD